MRDELYFLHMYSSFQHFKNTPNIIRHEVCDITNQLQTKVLFFNFVFMNFIVIILFNLFLTDKNSVGKSQEEMGHF